MKFYANSDASGNIIGFYNDDVHTNIPETAISITEQQWQDCINNQGKYIVQNGQLVAAPAHVPTVEEKRQAVLSKWESQIAEQRENLRKMVDEGKPQMGVDKIRVNLKSMIAQKNTELAGVQ